METKYFERCKLKELTKLKDVLQTRWEQIGQDAIDHAIGQFRKRLYR